MSSVLVELRMVEVDVKLDRPLIRIEVQRLDTQDWFVDVAPDRGRNLLRCGHWDDGALGCGDRMWQATVQENDHWVTSRRSLYVDERGPRQQLKHTRWQVSPVERKRSVVFDPRVGHVRYIVAWEPELACGESVVHEPNGPRNNELAVLPETQQIIDGIHRHDVSLRALGETSPAGSAIHQSIINELGIRASHRLPAHSEKTGEFSFGGQTLLIRPTPVGKEITEMVTNLEVRGSDGLRSRWRGAVR